MEVKEPTAPPKIYPELPINPDQYRYSKLLTIEKELKEEEIKHARLLKNYKKGTKATRITTHVLNGVTVASSAVAISTDPSGLGIIVSLPLAGVGGLCTLLSSGINFVGIKLQKRKGKTQGLNRNCQDFTYEFEEADVEINCRRQYITTRV